MPTNRDDWENNQSQPINWDRHAMEADPEEYAKHIEQRDAAAETAMATKIPHPKVVASEDFKIPEHLQKEVLP